MTKIIKWEIDKSFDEFPDEVKIFYQNNFIAGQANATFLENDDIETPSNFISNYKLRKLMLKMTGTCHDHRDAIFIAKIDT